MITRQRLLAEPHMMALRDHPALEATTDNELQSLEAFMGFCARHRIDDPRAADIKAFANLHDQVPDAILDLDWAFRKLGIGRELLKEVQVSHDALRHKKHFKGITKGTTRVYKRQFSVPVEELPEGWQQTLKRLDLEGELSKDILKRMKSRLGMFAWSAQTAGRPIDLADTVALTALYDDLRARSIAAQRKRERKKHNGLASNIDTPRWAYLRGSWEELRRFAHAHGLPQNACDKISKTYSMLSYREGRQTAEKIAKAREAGTLCELLKEASKMLADAKDLKTAPMRCAIRNRAAAIALGCVVPARPQDVLAHHVLGKGIFFEPERNAYRMRYKATKTRSSTGADINIPLLPNWNKFIDALILQDEHPRYLRALRTKAIAKQRSLYVHYDGTPAVYAWYSRMWKIVTNTGGQIARTLVYDEAILTGETGILYGRAVNAHLLHSPIVQKYRSERLVKAQIKKTQDIMADLFGYDDDEIESNSS
jgi:hypothetical protein